MVMDKTTIKTSNKNIVYDSSGRTQETEDKIQENDPGSIGLDHEYYIETIFSHNQLGQIRRRTETIPGDDAAGNKMVTRESKEDIKYDKLNHG